MAVMAALPTPPELADLLLRYQLQVEHPAACNAEADAWLAAPGLDDPALADLEHLPFVTIDNDDSKDLDQALYIEGHADGTHTVWYALADAAYYVRPGSALLAESLLRGASYYLPGLVVPMLPASLSEGLISLNEGVLRRALVFKIDLDARAIVTHVALIRGRIRSRKKLSYRGVQRYWDGAEAMPDVDYAPSLAALRVVGAQRIALAEASDVVRYQRVEVDVGLTATGFVAFESLRYETDRANEQISLLVNIEGARFLASSETDMPAIQGVFRVHPAPAPEHLVSFARMTQRVAAAHDCPAIAWGKGETLAAWLDRIATLPQQSHHLVVALQRQALLLNQRSMFSAEPGLHYGVGAPCYARFTSPMREVVGIFTHKEALESLGLVPPNDGDDVLRDEIIVSANRAKDVQHQLTKAANQLVIAALLNADLVMPEGERPGRHGTIVGFAEDKAYVLLDRPPLELKVYARDLGTKPRLGKDDASLAIQTPDGPRELVLGQRVSVTTTAYDPKRDRFALAIS